MNKDLDRSIIKEYKNVAQRMLHLSFPRLLNSELNDAIDYSINKRLKDHKAKIYNNYSDKTVDLSVLDVCDYILERKPILTSYGVLFTKKGERFNPISKLLKNFMEGRDILKGKMYQAPKGSEDFERYNLLQVLAKLDANGLR